MEKVERIKKVEVRKKEFWEGKNKMEIDPEPEEPPGEAFEKAKVNIEHEESSDMKKNRRQKIEADTALKKGKGTES